MLSANSIAAKTRQVALLGNPNCGKTTLFNALTGLRQVTANYPGVTVEKKEGRLSLPGDGGSVILLDLPGVYSLLPCSPDEEVVHDVLFGVQKGTERPDGLIVIADTSNLERNLYLVSQALELGIPSVIALNMFDVARKNGILVDLEKLKEETGCEVIPTVASKNIGIDELKEAIARLAGSRPASPLFPELPASLGAEIASVSNLLEKISGSPHSALQGEALRLLSDIEFRSSFFRHPVHGKELKTKISESRTALALQGIDWSAAEQEQRYGIIEKVCGKVLKQTLLKELTSGQLIDRILTHKIWGLGIFAAVMALIFQSIFSWAEAPMELISGLIETGSEFTASLLPEGMLESLVVDGVIAGVGNVIVFLPQIFLLFFFIAVLEDIGYMARAAFVLDRVMKKVGLNGKAFLPLLSSFACAIPGIMATRTIEDRNDRLATILVAPLMSCSARLPVYTLLIGAFIPATTVFGFFDMKGITLFSMYVLSLTAVLGMAALFRKTLLKGAKSPFVFELPPYRIPDLRTVFITTWLRGREFLVNAGTIIFILSILLWFLASFPKNEELHARYDAARESVRETYRGDELELRLTDLSEEESGEALRQSFAGRLGHFIEPVIKPLGFDWKIGIGLIGSFAAREVLVSTLAIVYNVGENQDENSVDLIQSLRAEKTESGKPLYTPLTGVTLMVFFVLACQCMSTLAVVRRETASWRWPVFMVFYMTSLAWIVSFAVYQGGRALGYG